MQINRRITNGLAWAGLFVVVAVPVADAISGQLMGDRGEIALASVDTVSAIEAPVPVALSQRPSVPAAPPVKVETAVAAPAKPVAAKPEAANPVVDRFLSSGKKLPSYITGGEDEPAAVATVAAPPATPPIAAAPASKPAAVAPMQTAVPDRPGATAPALDPVEVATLTPARIAPVPMPLSMRPAPIVRPVASQRANEDIVLPPEVVARNDAPVVDDLQDWESGPLSEFLARRQPQGSSAQVYDDDGFFLSDGPNNRRRGDRYIGPVTDETYYPFGN